MVPLFQTAVYAHIILCIIAVAITVKKIIDTNDKGEVMALTVFLIFFIITSFTVPFYIAILEKITQIK